MSGRIALFALALIAAGAAIPAHACNQHVLVSGYFSNNVAIYDACNGQFLRQLDQASRIRGAQAVRLNPADDLIYVVSEGNDQIQRYRHDDYSFVDVFAQLAGNIDPDGLAFGLDGRVYVASYGTSSVLELDRHTGQVIGTVLPNGSGLVGADNGMMVSAAGLLYVPGYDSNTVARVNLANGQVQGTFVAAGAGGLVNTRGIVDEGDTILVGGEGSGSVYRFNASTGALVGTLASGLSRPTGMTLAANGELLVLAGNRVRRIDRGSGAELGVLWTAAFPAEPSSRSYRRRRRGPATCRSAAASPAPGWTPVQPGSWDSAWRCLTAETSSPRSIHSHRREGRPGSAASGRSSTATTRPSPSPPSTAPVAASRRTSTRLRSRTRPGARCPCASATATTAPWIGPPPFPATAADRCRSSA